MRVPATAALFLSLLLSADGRYFDDDLVEVDVISRPPPRKAPTEPEELPPPPTPLCESDDDGSWGSVNLPAFEVGFRYQVETEPNNEEENILFVLEKAILDSIIPVLSLDCAEDELRRRQRRLANSFGASMLPEDTLLDIDCRSKLVDFTDCIVLQGTITIYSNPKQFPLKANQVRGRILDGMKSGEFNRAHPSIIQVISRDVDPIKPEDEDFHEVESLENREDDGRLAPGWIALAAVGVPLVLGIAMIAWFKRKPELVQEESVEERDTERIFPRGEPEIPGSFPVAPAFDMRIMRELAPEKDPLPHRELV